MAATAADAGPLSRLQSQQCILRISDTQTLKLINLYRKARCLWDTTVANYKNKDLREKLAVGIAEQLDIPKFEGKHVMMKFRNLRNSYCQELKKIAKSVSNGDKDVYVPKVFWFNQIDCFLRPHIQYVKSKTSPAVNQSDESSKEACDKNQVKSETDADGYPNESVFWTQPTGSREISNEFPPKVRSQTPDQHSSDDEEPSCIGVSDIEVKTEVDSDETEDWSIKSNQAKIFNTSIPESWQKPAASTAGYQSISSEDEVPVKPKLKRRSSSNTERSSKCRRSDDGKEDPFDTFGKYVASLLRNMPIQKALDLQPQIVTLITKAAISNTDVRVIYY